MSKRFLPKRSNKPSPKRKRGLSSWQPWIARFAVAGLIFLVFLLLRGFLIHPQRQSASIRCHTTNAGVRLRPEDGRVYVYRAGRAAELVAEGNLHETITVPPGQYDIRVLFSRSRDQQSQWLEGIAVAEGEQAVRNVQFSSGELSVEATVGAAAAQPGQVVAYVFKPQDHDQIITSMGSGEPVLIAPGQYDVRVVLTVESQEKDVRWHRDVQVKTGLQTKLNIRYRRGALLVKARNAGEQLPSSAVELTVYRAGDVQQEVVDSGLAGAPLGLPIGRYDIRATFTASNEKPFRWLRGLEIRDNETCEKTVEFSSGTVVLGAEIKGGGPLGDFQAYVYYYRAGDHQQPVTYTTAGQPAVLANGRYDVRVSFFRSHDRPDIWMRDLVVHPGQVVKRTVAFPSGKLLVRAYDAGGSELIGDNVFVYVYSAGERSRPIASARSGELLILTEGAYDIRVQDTRRKDREVWLKDIHLQAATLTEESARFGRQVAPGGG